jgi:hypothetical protein
VAVVERNPAQVSRQPAFKTSDIFNFMGLTLLRTAKSRYR